MLTKFIIHYFQFFLLLLSQTSIHCKYIRPPKTHFRTKSSLIEKKLNPNVDTSNFRKLSIGALALLGVYSSSPIECTYARSPISAKVITETVKDVYKSQSPGWELARQKRTVAIKKMENQKILSVNTDEAGNQYLLLPCIPNQAIPYKSLRTDQRLLDEMFAGAFGEISKDVLLHGVDTLKNRKQAAKKKKSLNLDDGSNDLISNDPPDELNALTTKGSVVETSSFSIPSFSFEKIKDLYSGFPVVLASSLLQGGTFFLVKNAVITVLNTYFNDLPSFITATVPIGFGVMGYWLFRTPAEVIKTNVQTGQTPNVMVAIEEAKVNGLTSLWKYYPVMLWLDIPFQILNFILFAMVSDAVKSAGFESTILTRLFCGITCGTISAGVTCPVDVCKTRIISRDKANTAFEKSLGLDNTLMILANQTSFKTSPEPVDQIEMLSNNKQAEVSMSTDPKPTFNNNKSVLKEMVTIYKEEGLSTLFLGLRQRLIYTGLANGIRLAAYGTSRMDLMMRSLDDL